MLLTMERLAAGQATRAQRMTANQVFVVVSGKGETTAGATRLAWEQGDTFVVPTWTAFEHRAASDARDFPHVRRAADAVRKIFPAGDVLKDLRRLGAIRRMHGPLPIASLFQALIIAMAIDRSASSFSEKWRRASSYTSSGACVLEISVSDSAHPSAARSRGE